MVRNSGLQHFFSLLSAVFISELGGFVTNVAIYLYVYDRTNASLWILGLSQVLFTGPLMLGTIFGGYLGEFKNKRSVMIICETANMFLVASMVFFTQSIWLILFLRAWIVFFAGIFNPSRTSMIKEIVPAAKLETVNGLFSAVFAILNVLGPMCGVLAYERFPNLKVILSLNIVTYLAAILLLVKVPNIKPKMEHRLNWGAFLHEIKQVITLLWRRQDLRALLRSCLIVGLCFGVFFPTLKPFVDQVLHGDAMAYGYMLASFGCGGIVGGILSAPLIRLFGCGRIFFVFGLVQSLLLLMWTQVEQAHLSYVINLGWGAGMMICMAAYLRYVQFYVGHDCQTRAFSIFDQSISFSAIIGAGVVTLLGNLVGVKMLLFGTAAVMLAFVLLNMMTNGMRLIYTNRGST